MFTFSSTRTDHNRAKIRLKISNVQHLLNNWVKAKSLKMQSLSIGLQITFRKMQSHISKMSKTVPSKTCRVSIPHCLVHEARSRKEKKCLALEGCPNNVCNKYRRIALFGVCYAQPGFTLLLRTTLPIIAIINRSSNQMFWNSYSLLDRKNDNSQHSCFIKFPFVPLLRYGSFQVKRCT